MSDGGLVSGELIFGEGKDVFPPGGATARVRLEEAGRADAPSRVVAEQVITGVKLQPGQAGRLTFSLHGPPPGEHERYIITAHVDMDGDGEVSRGDYITMADYPVPAEGRPARMTVRLGRIG